MSGKRQPTRLEDQGGGNVCASCERRRLCQHMAQALGILRDEPSPSVELRFRRSAKALQQRLDFLGFSYPFSENSCYFALLDAREARRLLFLARDLTLEWSDSPVEAESEGA